jgi:hypothetical protein
VKACAAFCSGLSEFQSPSSFFGICSTFSDHESGIVGRIMADQKTPNQNEKPQQQQGQQNPNQQPGQQQEKPQQQNQQDSNKQQQNQQPGQEPKR